MRALTRGPRCAPLGPGCRGLADGRGGQPDWRADAGWLLAALVGGAVSPPGLAAWTVALAASWGWRGTRDGEAVRVDVTEGEQVVGLGGSQDSIPC